jgi:basic amino acid/polyamine antiporter, APA family
MSPKTISLPSAVSLVITSMIGVGVFTSVGFQLLGLPSGFAILMLWVVGGIVSLCGALCYAELVAMMPKSGGEYHILREAYHPMAGFLAGWISITAGFAAPIAAVAMAFSKYAHTLGLNAMPQNVMAAVLIVGIAGIHFGSLRFIGGFLTATTFLKVGLILAFLVGALFVSKGQSPSLAPKAGDFALITSPSFATSLVYVMFAYLGWNGAAYVASEVRDPQRNVPLAFCLGILIVMVLYIVLNAVFLWCTPWDAMKGQVEAGIIAAKSIFGETGGQFMGGLIAFGIISTVAGFTWAGSRVNQRIGQDFASLGFLANLNRYGAPAIALVLQTVMSLVMLFSGTFDQVINYLMSQLILCSMLAVLAVPIMRWRAPQVERPFRVPLYPVPPVIFLGVSLWMLVFQVRARPVETAWGLLTLVIGSVVYAAVHLHQRKSPRADA